MTKIAVREEKLQTTSRQYSIKVDSLMDDEVICTSTISATRLVDGAILLKRNTDKSSMEYPLSVFESLMIKEDQVLNHIISIKITGTQRYEILKSDLPYRSEYRSGGLSSIREGNRNKVINKRFSKDLKSLEDLVREMGENSIDIQTMQKMVDNLEAKRL